VTEPKTSSLQLLSLKDVADQGLFSDGDWVESKDQDPNGEIRLLQLADVGDGEFRDKSSRWLRQDQADTLKVTYVVAGDILIARMPDPLGRACIVPALSSKAITAVDVAILRISRSDVDARYVMWWLNSPKTRATIANLASGTTRQRISRKNLEALTLPIPPLSEQQRIVATLEDHLSRLEKAKADIERSAKATQRFTESLLHDIFSTDFVLRELGCTKIERKNLSEVAEVQSGGTPKGLERLTSDSPTEGFSVPFYKVGDMNRDERYMVSSRSYLTEAQTKDLKLKGVPKGSVVFPKAGGAIATNKKRLVKVPGPIDLNCMAVIPGEQMLPTYLAWWFESFKLSDLANGSILPQIGKSAVKQVQIPCLSLDEQELVVNYLEEKVSIVREQARLLRQAESSVELLRRSLLNDAFKGKLLGGIDDGN